MIARSPPTRDTMLNDLAENYAKEDYEVLREPTPNVIPFDLGGYGQICLHKGGPASHHYR